MNILHTLAFLIATAGVAVAEPPKAVNTETIKDKVSVTLLEESTVEFKLEGDRLLQPSKSKGTAVKKAAVQVKLRVTSASPVPPPREGATRPFLTVTNNFEKALHFRALVRLKGSKEFFEMNKDMEPLPAGDFYQKCWDFDSVVEEVILCEFKLSDKPVQ